MKKTFKGRVLKYLVLVLFVTSILSTLIAYVYFNQVVRKQVIQDEEVKLNQLIYQLEFMVDDIKSFSKSIAINQLIQENVSKSKFENEFEKAKIRYEIANQLVFYKSLRNYIGTITLHSPHGTNYSSIANADQIYFETKFKIKELNDYMNNDTHVFSNPFYAFERDVFREVISYKTEIRNFNRTEQIIGVFYMDIYLDYFLNQIKTYATGYEGVFLKGNYDEIIYSEGITESEDGIIIMRPISNMGWEVGTFISNAHIRQQSHFVLRFFLIFFVFSIISVILLVSCVLDNVIKPITKLTHTMETIDYNTLSVELDIHTDDEIELLSIRFEEMLNKINKYTQEMLKKEQIQKEMEFDVLLSQVNPHYLYNVLNTVIYLSAAKRNEDVVIVVNALLYSLQETLKVGDKHIFTSLETELELVDTYLKIQRIRYPNVFEFKRIYAGHLDGAIIPKTIIQPIIENSILHGILPAERKGCIQLEIFENKGIIEISVSDNGVGIASTNLYEKNNEKNRKSIGLENIHQRLQYIYGREYGLVIEQQDIGTCVKIKIPLDNQ